MEGGISTIKMKRYKVASHSNCGHSICSKSLFGVEQN